MQDQPYLFIQECFHEAIRVKNPNPGFFFFFCGGGGGGGGGLTENMNARSAISFYTRHIGMTLARLWRRGVMPMCLV